MNIQIAGLLYDIEAKIIKRTNSPGYGSIYFECLSEIQLTNDQLQDVQMRLGYHPAGYGFYSVSNQRQNDKISYTWHCSASCD